MTLASFWGSLGIEPLWHTIEGSALGQYIAGSEWAFPTLESVHVIAIVTVVGSIMVMDLRLLGLTSKDQPVTAMSRDTLPWTWTAFVLALITGSLLFISKAVSYMHNPYFILKMCALGCAGANMMLFHSTTWKTVGRWNENVSAVPTAAKVSAGLSLFFWLFVIFFGRAIGFTLGIYQ
jgi:hypothetical protein